MRKTPADIRREEHAHAMNAKLIGTGLSVAACRGGYVVQIGRMGRKKAEQVVTMLRLYLECREAIEETAP